MFSRKSCFKNLLIVSISTLALSACTPAFETQSQRCSTSTPVTLATQVSLDSADFTVQAGSDTNEYKLYLEDALNSLNGLQSKSIDVNDNIVTQDLTPDQQTAIQFIIDKTNEKMGYIIESGTVKSASNPIDYIESIIAATDEDEVVQTFIDIKQNLADAINANDDNCKYSNSSIRLIVEDENNSIVKTVNTQLDFNFNPFDESDNRGVDQITLVSLDELIDQPIDELGITERQKQSFFSGISRVSADDFNATGVSPPEVRQVTLNDTDTNETFFFDDDFKVLKLGQLVTTFFNQICTLRDEDGNEIEDANGNTTQAACPTGVATRQIIHPSCNGTDPDGTDETGQIQENFFTVVSGNPALTDLQRLRLEVDYPNNEIRLYASKYAEKILIAGADIDNYNPVTEVITNPTRCEQQAVLNELNDLVTEEERNADGFEGVRLTLIEDPNYDIKYQLDANGNQERDENGNLIVEVEPNPIFTFQGTAIPDRQ